MGPECGLSLLPHLLIPARGKRLHFPSRTLRPNQRGHMYSGIRGYDRFNGFIGNAAIDLSGEMTTLS
jgi:hypothetical protein